MTPVIIANVEIMMDEITPKIEQQLQSNNILKELKEMGKIYLDIIYQKINESA